MFVNRPFEWLSKFLDSPVQIQSLDLVPTLQPTVSVACNWPLEYTHRSLSATLAAGTNNFFMAPGVEPTLPISGTVPPENYHFFLIGARIALSAALAVEGMVELDDGTELQRWFSGNSTELWPFEGIVGRPYIKEDFRFNFQVAGGAGGATCTIDYLLWERPDSMPLIPGFL